LKTERRAVARYKASLAVQIGLDDYDIAAMSNEVSQQGLRVICDGPAANKIFNRYIRVTPGEKITADIQIKSLSVNGLTNSIRCKARVVSVNRVSKHGLIICLQIIHNEKILVVE